jgi:small multidrug resistance pump
MLSWILLVLAIVSEVAATVSLKLSDGFTRLAPAIMVIAGYACSFFLLSKILERGLHLGVVYAIWSATGIALIVIVDAIWFDSRLSLVQIGGLALIVTGIVALQAGGATA